jgi:hypothetical protein
MAGYASVDPSHATRLSVATLVNCKAGIVQAANAGAAYDSLLYGVYIQFVAGPPTLTIGGLADQAGAAQNLLISGSTTVDYFWMPPAPILNNFAAFTFTASVANVIWVFTRAYIGPEAPQVGFAYR